MPAPVQIRGPILSVGNLGDHGAFFGGPLEMQETARVSYCQEQTSALLGANNVSLESVYYEHQHTAFGVRLWRFDPPHEDTVRYPNRGTDRDALKVVDFYACNFEDSLEKLREAGHVPKTAIADYELPEGRIREAHFWRPDNIVCAVISGPRDFFEDFVSTLDQPFSEPQSISAPVTDVDSVVAFYHDVFGLKPLHRYEISNPSFDALVGSDQPMKLTAINIGSDLKQPYLGVIDYGKATTGESLLGRSRPPVRGLIGIELDVQNIDAVLAAAISAKAGVLAGPTTIDYPPLGEVVSAVIEGPHGVIHHVIQSNAIQHKNSSQKGSTS